MQTGHLMVMVLIYFGAMWGAVWLFFRREFRYSPIISALISVCTYALLIFLYMQSYHAEKRLIASVFSVCICIVSLRILWKGSFSVTAFYVLMVKSYLDCISLIQIVVCSRWDGLSWMRVQLQNALGAAYLICVLLWAFLYLLIIKLFKPLMMENREAAFWKYLWVIPAFYYSIYRLAIDRIYEMYNENVSVLFVLAIIWFAGIFLSYIVLLKMLIELSRKEQLQQQLISSEMQIEGQYHRLESMRENMEEIRRQRHDIRHYLLLLDQYAQEGENKKIRDSIQNYLEEHSSGKQPYICDNSVLNMILQYYRECAEKKGIDLQYTAQVPEKIPFAEQDLAVLAGNLLENAVEASEKLPEVKERKIRCQIRFLNKDMLAVIVSNSFSGELRMEHGKLMSSKGTRHGIGLSSVKKLAEKYDGVMNCEYSDQEFRVSVLLKGHILNGEK